MERTLFVGWGKPTPGRETQAPETFNKALQQYETWQQGGQIEHYDVVLFDPTADLSGMATLHGSPEQIDSIRHSDEFRDLMAEANLVVKGLRVYEGACGDALKREIERFERATQQVPSLA